MAMLCPCQKLGVVFIILFSVFPCQHLLYLQYLRMSVQQNSDTMEDQAMSEEISAKVEMSFEQHIGEQNAPTTAVPEKTKETERVPVPGNSLSLPIARIKRIIKQDDDITACSTSAVYAIGCATVCCCYFSCHFENDLT